MHPEELIARWQAWDSFPGSKPATHTLVDAVTEYAGDQVNDLYRHVAASRQAGMTIAAAIYTWSPQ